MARLLSDVELIELTGYQAPSKQLEALRKLGLVPVIRPDGRPRITDDALTQAMLGRGADTNTPTQPGGAAPAWTELRKRA